MEIAHLMIANIIAFGLLGLFVQKWGLIDSKYYLLVICLFGIVVLAIYEILSFLNNN